MYRFIAIVVLSFSLLVSSFPSAMATKHSAMTPQDYVEYLTERGKEDRQALKVRQKFLSLSIKDQQKFIDYTSNPERLEEILDTPVTENSKK